MRKDYKIERFDITKSPFFYHNKSKAKYQIVLNKHGFQLLIDLDEKNLLFNEKDPVKLYTKDSNGGIFKLKGTVDDRYDDRCVFRIQLCKKFLSWYEKPNAASVIEYRLLSEWSCIDSDFGDFNIINYVKIIRLSLKEKDEIFSGINPIAGFAEYKKLINDEIQDKS